MADPDQILQQYGWADPRVLDPEDYKRSSLPPRELGYVPPLPPRAELRNAPSIPRPSDAMAPVAELISPTMGAYGMGNLAGDTYLKGREGDWKGVAGNLPELAMAALPMPGAKGKGRPRLDLSPEAKAARAAEMGFWPEQFYHGTTHKFREFADPAMSARYESEGWHGPAVYMSSSPSDARGNYAGIGPDLTQRIDRRADQIFDPDGRWKRRAEKLIADGTMPEYHARDPENAMRWAQAHADLVGKVPDGRLLELRTNARNPVHVGGEKDTVFRYELPEYGVERRGDEFHVVDKDGRTIETAPTEDRAYDHATDLRYEEMPTGPGARLLEAIGRLREHDAFAGRGEEVVSDFLARVQDEMSNNEGIRASALERMLREQSDIPVYGLDWNLTPGQLLQNWYRDLGHDAVAMHNAEKVFPGMHLPANTTHVALFDPRRVRDVNARFDPAQIDSRNLMAGVAGATAVPGVVLGSYYSDKKD